MIQFVHEPPILARLCHYYNLKHRHCSSFDSGKAKYGMLCVYVSVIVLHDVTCGCVLMLRTQEDRQNRQRSLPMG